MNGMYSPCPIAIEERLRSIFRTMYGRRLFSRSEMLAAADVPNERARFWEKTGIVRVSPGRGNAGRYHLGDALFYRHVKLLAEAGVALKDARRMADLAFPEYAPVEPRGYAVIHGGRQYLTTLATGSEEVIPPDVDSAIMINLRGMIYRTIQRAEAVLARGETSDKSTKNPGERNESAAEG